MATRIERIEMNSFRGATVSVTIGFDPSKPITLIFGENGSGKSTIVDALDFVLNEQYGSLTDRSSTKPKAHLPSLGSAASKLEVSVCVAGKTWTARLGSSGPKTTGPEPRPTATILRRSQMLQFINETPKKRYEALRDFIALPAIEKSESSLRAACKRVSSDYSEAVRAKEQADEALTALWNDEGQPGKDAWAWAKSHVSRDATELGNSVATLTAILRAHESASSARERLNAARDQHAAASTALQKAEEEMERAETGSKRDGAALVSLLEQVQRYLETREQPEACPVCESPDRSADLRDSVMHRLGQMKRVAAILRQVDDAKMRYQNSQAVLADAEKAFSSAVRLMWVSYGTTLSKGIDIDTSQFQLLRDGEPELTGNDAIAEAESLCAAVDNSRERISARRDRDQKTLNQLTAVKNDVTTVETKTESAKVLESQAKRLSMLLDILESNRKRYVDEVLGSVESTVEAMYSRVHPDEGIGKVRLYLKPNVMGSLEFDAKFQHAAGVPPQAYYSDSHLDTLGICVFLALARHFNDESSVVILDDVLASADSDHMDRLMAMLEGEASNFNQLIITTHHRPWLERYRHSGSSKVGLIEFLPWSLSEGVRTAKTGPT